MQVWLRLLIVWLLAFALPVQGMAGVTMAHCGPSHERMGAAVKAAQHGHADHDAGEAHHHDHGATQPHGVEAADHDVTTPGHAHSGKASDLAQYKCSSCASCCAGFALPSTPARWPRVQAASAVFAEEPVTVDAFASDGPDRPPRRHRV